MPVFKPFTATHFGFSKLQYQPVSLQIWPFYREHLTETSRPYYSAVDPWYVMSSGITRHSRPQPGTSKSQSQFRSFKHMKIIRWVLSHWQIIFHLHRHSLFSSYTTVSWHPPKFRLRSMTILHLYLPNCSYNRSVWYPATTTYGQHTALCCIINKLFSQ